MRKIIRICTSNFQVNFTIKVWSCFRVWQSSDELKVFEVFLWFWKTYLKLWTTFSSGTPFMVRLHEQLKFFVNYKISTDLAWQGLKIYLSGHEVWIYSTRVLKKWLLQAQYPALVIFPFWFIHLNACNFKFLLIFCPVLYCSTIIYSPH